MTQILAERANEKRAAGEALIREADDLACQSWNERMWADGGPIDPLPTIDQAINGGYAWLDIACSRCKTPRNVDLCALPHVPSTCVHDLAGRLRCVKCRKAGKRPPATLHQLAQRKRQYPGDETTARRPNRTFKLRGAEASRAPALSPAKKRACHDRRGAGKSYRRNDPMQ